MSRLSIKEKSSKKPVSANRSIKKKMSLGIYAAVVIAAVAARTDQLLSNMDLNSGRLTDPSLFRNSTFLIVAAGLILIAAVLLFGSARDRAVKSCILINPMRLRYDRLNKKIPSAGGFCSLLMALLVIIQIVFEISGIVSRNKKIAAALPKKEADNFNLLTGYSGGMIFTHIIMLIAAFTFISIAVNIFKKEGFSHANCAALMFCALWQLIELGQIVFTNTAAVLFSNLNYEILSRAAAIVFYLSIARFFNGMENKSTRFLMCFSGYAASIFAAVSTVPRYILFLDPKNIDTVIGMDMPRIAEAGTVFFTISVVTVFWTTYVYRVMPRLNIPRKRWGGTTFVNKDYMQMETLSTENIDLDRESSHLQ